MHLDPTLQQLCCVVYVGTGQQNDMTSDSGGYCSLFVITARLLPS